MAQAQIFGELFGDLGKGVHNWSTASLKAALSNTDLALATGATFSQVTEIAAGFGYTATGHTLDSEAWAETGAGTDIWQLTTADEVFTAAGGSIGPFRYVYLYNETPTSPADPLLAKLDYGSSITITDGNTFTLDVGANGWLRFGRGTIS
jgi:hypothetical protein